MKLHKEGTATIIIVFIALLALNIFTYIYAPITIWVVGILSLGFLFFILRFFRIPNRAIASSTENEVLAPCDGKVVVIEKVMEPEYFKGERMQISIFMSPNNVHANWAPIDGEVTFTKYHPGKHLVAWHPKSSTDNERTSIVLKHTSGTEILCRQIAGALARRIVYYTEVGKRFNKGEEIGFIKLGSRVDVFLPIDANIKVELGQVSVGKQTIIASI